MTVLKNQLRDINMMDQFAKHAKIQRKINKIQDELSDGSEWFLFYVKNLIWDQIYF